MNSADGKIQRPQNERENLVQKHRMEIGVASLLLVLLGFLTDFLFAIADIPWFPGFWEVIKYNDVLPDQAVGQVIGAIAALFGGTIALFTYTLTYRQKQNHFEKQREQEQEHFALQREQKQAQSDYDAIAAEYDALSKDFVHKDELARINAAIGLAAIAKKADPRKVENLKQVKAIPKTNEFFPWYERIAMQLASALIIYEESRARDQVRISIRDIATIDSDPGMQPLLTFLINTLADANRTAYKTFMATVAEGVACEKEEHLDTFARAITIFSDPGLNKQMLIALREKFQFSLILDAQRDIRKLNPALTTPGDPDDTYLLRLNISSQQLADTRDSISDCVHEDVRKIGFEIPLPGKLDWPEFSDISGWIDWQKNLERGHSHVPRVSLSECFLQSAYLSGAQLQAVDLFMAELQRADLDGAHLQGAHITGADLYGATIYVAQLQGADLAGSNLSGSNLYGANLYGANLEGANFYRAKLENAILQEASFGVPAQSNMASNIRWAEADLRVGALQTSKNGLLWSPTKVRDLDLIKFLRTHFPDGGPKEGALWPDGLLHEEDYAPRPKKAVPKADPPEGGVEA